MEILLIRIIVPNFGVFTKQMTKLELVELLDNVVWPSADDLVEILCNDHPESVWNSVVGHWNNQSYSPEHEWQVEVIDIPFVPDP